jgi:hypothetical protein
VSPHSHLCSALALTDGGTRLIAVSFRTGFVIDTRSGACSEVVTSVGRGSGSTVTHGRGRDELEGCVVDEATRSLVTCDTAPIASFDSDACSERGTLRRADGRAVLRFPDRLSPHVTDLFCPPPLCPMVRFRWPSGKHRPLALSPLACRQDADEHAADQRRAARARYN